MFNNNNTNTGLFSNPFKPQQTTPADTAAMYAQLEALKANKANIAQIPLEEVEKKSVKKTVYDDISDAWQGLSPDERTFIEESEEYRLANVEYQQAFNSFLLEKMSDEFIKSKYGTTPEKILGVIKTKKDQFQANITNDISIIKKQNETLLNKNDELTKNNLEMQKVIKELQDKVWMK